MTLKFNCRFPRTTDENDNLGFFWGVVFEITQDGSQMFLHGRRMPRGWHNWLWEGFGDPIYIACWSSWFGWLPYMLAMFFSGIFLRRRTLELELSQRGWVRHKDNLLELVVRCKPELQDKLIQLELKTTDDAIRIARLLKRRLRTSPR